MTDTSKSTIVLISGGNSGLGLATAKRLATEHNYTVIIGSRNASKGESIVSSLRSQSPSINISCVQLDLDSDTSISAAIDHIANTYGRLDVLINNAGIILDGEVKGPMSTRDVFTGTFSSNVTGAACLTEACLPLLQKSEFPRVIFVSSVMGSITLALDKSTSWYASGFTAYESSKSALNMVAAQYTRIFAEKGGLVNCACPGLVSTNFSDFTKQYGHPPEVGAQRILELATAEKGSATGTFSNVDGPLPW